MLLPPHLIAHLPRRGGRGLRRLDRRLYAPKELRRLGRLLRLAEFEGCAYALRRLRLRRLRRLLRLVVVFKDVYQSFFILSMRPPVEGRKNPTSAFVAVTWSEPSRASPPT